MWLFKAKSSSFVIVVHCIVGKRHTHKIFVSTPNTDPVYSCDIADIIYKSECLHLLGMLRLFGVKQPNDGDSSTQLWFQGGWVCVSPRSSVGGNIDWLSMAGHHCSRSCVCVCVCIISGAACVYDSFKRSNAETECVCVCFYFLFFCSCDLTSTSPRGVCCTLEHALFKVGCEQASRWTGEAEGFFEVDLKGSKFTAEHQIHCQENTVSHIA